MFGLLFVVVFTSILAYTLFEIIHIGDGKCAILERFGRFVMILQPGSHIIFRPLHALRPTRMARHQGATTTTRWRSAPPRAPGVGGAEPPGEPPGELRGGLPLYLLSTMRQLYDPPAWNFRTSDGIDVTLDVVVLYRIADACLAVYGTADYLATLKEEIRGGIHRFIASKPLSEIRPILRTMNSSEADEGSLDFAVNPLDHHVDKKTLRAQYGIEVEKVMLQNFGLPEHIERANIMVYSKMQEIDAEAEMNRCAFQLQQTKAANEQDLADVRADREITRLRKLAEAEADRVKLLIDAKLDLTLVAKLRAANASLRAADKATAWTIKCT